MLVLSRKPTEKIVIEHGEEKIIVSVVRLGNNSVRLGVDAPEKWLIYRESSNSLNPSK
jgi:carbon storage regulator CsrA